MTATRVDRVSTQTVFNVQVLRAIASILVVHAHASGPSGLRLAWVGGTNGVDLFFVISGFIIAYVADIDSSRFMTRRLIRIVPIYWASTLAIYALVLVMPSMFRTTSSNVPLLIRSLLFLPDPNSLHLDGTLHPTLAGGWTLNYEMYFYVTFWLALMISRKWAPLIASAAIATIVIVVNTTSLDDSRIWHFYGSPIVLEFVFGIVAFYGIRYAEQHPFRERWPLVQKYLLGLGIGIGFACLAFNAELFGSGPRWIQSGIPAFFVLVCAVLLEKVHHGKITNRTALMMGDASYVLYLLHAYIVYGVTRLFVNQTFSEPVGQVIVLGLICVSVAISALVYRYFEQPILKRLKSYLLPSRPRPAQA